jgi:hypothetical protein
MMPRSDAYQKAWDEFMAALNNMNRVTEAEYGPMPSVEELLRDHPFEQKIPVNKRTHMIRLENETDDYVLVHIFPKPM